MSESATIKMSKLARNLAAEGHDVISLSLGEPDFDTPDHIKEAAIQALRDGYTKYTPVPGSLELRQAIQRKFREENDLHFDVSQIVVSNGAKQSIANVSLTLLNPGDEVIIFGPYWVSYYEIVRLGGGRPVILNAGVADDFKVSPQMLDEAITEKTKFLLFSSPCNPTGSVYSHEEMANYAEVLARHPHIYVVADEIYEYINFREEHVSIGSFEPLRDRAITINGFSKGFAMTGWRLGYMGAPKEIAAACAKMQGQFTSGASAFGQKAAAHALNADRSATEKMKNAFKKRRDLVISLINDIQGVVCNKPEGAFYIFPDVHRFFGKSDGVFYVNNADDLSLYLLKKGACSRGKRFCFR